jgi:hypothetical protein
MGLTLNEHHRNPWNGGISVLIRSLGIPGNERLLHVGKVVLPKTAALSDSG